MRKMICAVCGKPAEIESFCSEHYPKQKLRMKKKVFVNVCKVCDVTFVGDKRINLRKEIEDNSKIPVSVEMQKGKAIVTPLDPRYEKLEVWITQKKTTCDECQKRSGGYYEAIVQLRPKLESALNTVSGNKDVVKIEELPEGYDLYMLTTTSAKRVTEALRGITIEKKQTVKMAGMKKGMILNRVVVLLRLKEPEEEAEKESE